ncbi:MAG: glycosyltransferase family A protein [Thermoleophilia bacterium]
MGIFIVTRPDLEISVLIVTFNGARHIREAIESVRAQTFTDWEMLIADDGSTDDTLRVVHSVGDPRITVLPQKHLGDQGHWRNMVARHYGRGNHVAPLDHDGPWMPPKLALQHATLEGTVAALVEHRMSVAVRGPTSSRSGTVSSGSR